MELIADGLLIAAAGTAALYCWVLSRRLNALRDLDKGLGGAIASLSAQVDETRASLADAKSTTREQSREMQDLTRRAEAAASKLEMILAAVQEKSVGKPSGAPKQSDPAAKGPREATKSEKRQANSEESGAKVPIAARAILQELEQVSGPEKSSQLRVAVSPPDTPALMEDKKSGGAAPKNEGKAEAKSALITRLRGLAQATAS